ncbi:MAG: ATP-binding protein, partial [Bacteroidota bacterium]
QSKTYPPEKESLFLSQIIKNSKQLLTLINDIIDISKIEACQLKIDESEVNLNVLMDELFNLFDKERNEELKLISHKGLKEEESNVITDQDRLKQVMNNLLSNALKFTESGSVTFGYEKKDENTLLFYVRDTGIGISKEQQNIIFDRFKQAEDGTTKKFSGTGLGLAISKELTELMGGNIRVTSQKKKGSEFAFTIPFKQGRNTKTQATEDSKPTVYNWSDKTILVVEDNEANYLFLQACLAETGCTVIRASDGKTAIEKGIQSDTIDLILMDIQLPETDGITATKEIKKHKRNLPIIAQTAYAMQGDKEKTLDAGCNDYIEKPIDPQNLLKIISTFF